MLGTVTVGIDGLPESWAAAEWAAREAKLRDLPLRIVHVRESAPEPLAQAPLLGAETERHWTELDRTDPGRSRRRTPAAPPRRRGEQ